MQMIEVYYSDCCGCESDPDYGVCSRCGEHCEIVTEEIPA